METLVCSSSIHSPKCTGLGKLRNVSVHPQTEGASIFMEVLNFFRSFANTTMKNRSGNKLVPQPQRSQALVSVQVLL